MRGRGERETDGWCQTGPEIQGDTGKSHGLRGQSSNNGERKSLQRETVE